jgi:hypothetical protein
MVVSGMIQAQLISKPAPINANPCHSNRLIALLISSLRLSLELSILITDEELT